MIEVVFGDSIKASMLAAKSSNDIGASGGNDRVVNIGINLDIGDISGALDGPGRQHVYEKMLMQYDESRHYKKRFFENQRRDMDILLAGAKAGERIRIWKSNAPDTICGFYYICSILYEIDCDMSVISMPEYIQTGEESIILYSNWGEVGEEELSRFLSLEKQVTAFEKQMLSNCWRELMEENTRLRANVNGKLISVPEDFYDHLIRCKIPDHDFIMSRLLGELIGEYYIGVSDGWYELRIQKMIEEGELSVIAMRDESSPHGMYLRKNRL